MSLSTPKRRFTGQELVERWGLNPAQLSLCMQVGLQPYLLKEDEPSPLLVIDPVGITDEQRNLARLQLLSLGGRQRCHHPPDRFTGNRVQPVIAPRFHPMYYRVFDSDEVDRHAVIAEHMECQFISEDIYEFERAYGLGAESIPPRQNDEMYGEGTLREPPMLSRVSSQGEGGPKAAASANNPEDEGTTGSSFDSEYARKLTEQWILDGDPARPRLKIDEIWLKLAYDPFYGYGNLDQVAMIIQNSGGSANLFPSWFQPRPKQLDIVHLWCAKMGLPLYREGELEPFEWGLDGRPYRDHWRELDDCLISKEDLRAFLTEQKLPLPEFWFPAKPQDSPIQEMEVRPAEGGFKKELQVKSADLVACFYRKENRWRIGPENAEIPFFMLKGLEYIWYLLNYPRREFSPTELSNLCKTEVPSEDEQIFSGMSGDELYEEGLSLSQSARQGMADETAIRQVKARLAELEDILREQNDVLHGNAEIALEQKQKVEREIQVCRGYLAEVDPFGNRITAFRNQTNENARIAVSKAIRRAIEQIQKDCPSLAQQLSQQTIHTGKTLSYTPAGTPPVRWKLNGNE